MKWTAAAAECGATLLGCLVVSSAAVGGCLTSGSSHRSTLDRCTRRPALLDITSYTSHSHLASLRMAASPTTRSLLSDDLEDRPIDAQLLALLDRPATRDTEASPVQIDTSQQSTNSRAQLETHSSEPSSIYYGANHTAALPNEPSDSAATPTAVASLATPVDPAATRPTERDDLLSASYATLPFPLPAHVPMPSTAWSLLQSPPTVLSFGCPLLDELMDGGLRPGVAELVGEAGSAKSQICFQLLLQVQLSLPPPAPAPRFPLSHYGLDGCGFYIVTEGRPPMTRLQQLQEAMHRRFEYTAGYDFLANVFMQEAHSVDQLLSIVEQLCVDRERVREQRLRLLIIDSVAGLFRVDDEVSTANSPARAEVQFRLSSALRRLSSQQQMVVVACNQVTDRFLPAEPILRSSETYRDRYTILSSGRQVLPALGLSWANCVDVRLAVSRRGGGRGGGGGSVSMVLDGSEVLREMDVVFAPHLPRRSMNFVVDADGVRGVEATMKLLDGADSGDEWKASATKVEQPLQRKQQHATAGFSDPVPLTPISINLPSAVSAKAVLTKNVR